MKFLVDVNIGVGVVDDLKAAGHDVVYVGAIDERMPDSDIPKNAAAQGRIVISIDKDFGRHIFAEGLPHTGIIRLRTKLLTQFSPARNTTESHTPVHCYLEKYIHT